MPGIGVSMTLTLKDFIHLFQWLLVFLAIFGLGKVLWFCLTKVSGKNQSYTNLYWFCKNCNWYQKVVKKKTKSARYPENQKISRNYKIFRIGKKSILSVKGCFNCILKSVLCKSLIVLIVTLLYCIYMFMLNCVLTEHLAV